MRRGGLAVGAALTLCLLPSLATGCGTERPPPGDTGTFGSSSPAAGASFGDTDTKPPGCGQREDGTFCECLDAPLFVDPPNLYFVLDRSGSMSANDKWDQVRLTVARLMRSLGPRANYGATVFPGFGTADCAEPAEVMPVRPGDPPSSTDGPTTKLLITATSNNPYGGTPTTAALKSVLPRLRRLTGKTFVILATDGGPNCNAQASCDVDRCLPNMENVPGCPPSGPTNCCQYPDGVPESCLDDVGGIEAINTLKVAGFPTYVIGIPGSGSYASVLDAFAVAGGTAIGASSPKYYRVDTSGEQALQGALKKVAAKIVATCTYTLKDAPKDPKSVNVYLDDVVLPQDPANGWTLSGNVVTLVGSTCERVMAGDVLGVRVIVGCPTVQPR